MQRVFDIENEQDMQDLFNILPDDVLKIEKDLTDKGNQCDVYIGKNYYCRPLFINIDWHDKTEIKRPIQEATEADIGKLCVFYDDIKQGKSYGILEGIGEHRYDFKYFKFNCLYKHCRRLTKQEIEELC